MRSGVSNDSWREARKNLLAKWNGLLVCNDPSPYYMAIPTPYCHLSNVLPEEQEEIIFSELKLFLMGNQTENIRLGDCDSNGLPTSIEVNISFDPYIRSEIERFHDILLSAATIKICCFEISHDMMKFSRISGAVVSCIDAKVNEFIMEICEKLDGFTDSSQQLNNLYREIHAIHETLVFFSDVVKTIYTEQLIGGQVLSLLDQKRQQIFSRNSLQDLDDVFQCGWKIFAEYIGQLVCKFDADGINYEFVVWNTEKVVDSNIKRLLSNSSKETRSTRYTVIDALCPTFFAKYLDILVRCAEFGEVLKADDIKRRKGKELIENVMDDVRNADWNNLDVNTTVRMLVQFSRKESACLLREITSATNVDQAVRDIHDLLLRGSWAHTVMLQCIKLDILQKPIDEVGKIRLKKLWNDILGTASEKDHPFWKYFSFKIEKHSLFEMLGERNENNVVGEIRNRNVVPALFECLSLHLEFPIDIEPVISKSAVFMLIPIFRIWLLVHVATWTISNMRDSLRGMMPSRSGSDLAAKKHLMYALDWKVSGFKQTWARQVDVAIAHYYERITKATSLDEYTECQGVLSRDVTKMMGITEMYQLENIKDILSIIWNYEAGDISLGDLIADFEEVQSRVQMEY